VPPDAPPSNEILRTEAPSPDETRIFPRLVQTLLLIHLFLIGSDWLEIRGGEAAPGGPAAGEVFGSRFGYSLFGDAIADRLIFVRGDDGVIRPCTNSSDRVPIRESDLARSAFIALCLMVGCHVPMRIVTEGGARIPPGSVALRSHGVRDVRLFRGAWICVPKALGPGWASSQLSPPGCVSRIRETVVFWWKVLSAVQVPVKTSH